MRETVEAFEARTGARYDPPAALRAQGRVIRSRDACPTLFRVPGPLGMRDHLNGAGAPLAPADAAWIWLADKPTGGARRQAELFGAVAVLAPLALSPCRVRRGHWLGVNRALPDDLLAWVPPSSVRAALDWGAIASRAEAEQALGPGLAAERAQVIDRLGDYLEELAMLAAAGAPGPDRPWCEVPARERHRVLAAAGVSGRFTR